MTRPKKIPTTVVRLNIEILKRARKNAKKRKMSLPDYLAWRIGK